ncbi:(E2-independent) E3 ubiquitin-conjugating enzyme FATS isoform X2 [Brachyhypopomus gauderio]|uniref:(E2-independent) E3 ubiquitin-conjugating enzyme FATS isoform X2 n=1 Tax=Brachyhypopomus gauderio TaxID=698409 RepID=UPI004042F2E1
MDVKSETQQWLPKLRGRAGGRSVSVLPDAPAWRRSGDKCSCERLAVQVNRAPRDVRPWSCIEGELADAWLPPPEQLWARPTQSQRPAFAQRTASVPVLMNVVGGESSYYLDYPYDHRGGRDPSVSPSVGDGSLGSLDSLDSQTGLETTEMARMKVGPITQKAKLCYLAPVQVGWLPLRRRVVTNDSLNYAHGHDSSTSQVNQKTSADLVPSCSSVQSNGLGPGDGEAEGRGSGITSGSQNPGSTRDQPPPQTAGKKSISPSDGDQGAIHDWTTRVQMPESENSKLPPSNFMGCNTLVHRRGSAPQSSPLTAPPTGSSSTPKHSSSLSSITITSRMVGRSSSLPDTSCPPEAGGVSTGLMAINTPPTDHAKYPHSHYLRQIMTQRKALMIKVTEHRAQARPVIQSSDKSTYPAPSNQNQNFSKLTTRGSFVPPTSNFNDTKNHTSPASLNITGRDSHAPVISNASCRDRPSLESSQPIREPQTSVVLRRKPTILKVGDQRDLLTGESKGCVAPPEHRHSYTAGLYTTRPASDASRPTIVNAKLPTANDLSSTEVGSAQPEGRRKEEFHRSTLSVQLRSTNSSPAEKPSAGVALRPQRPASCYASLFNPSEPRANVGTDPGLQSWSFTFPRKTNTDPGSPSTSSSNQHCSTEGETGSCGVAWDVEQSERVCAQPLTLIRVPEPSTRATHHAILALNAAAVIANVKAQGRQRREAQADESSRRAEQPAAPSTLTETSQGRRRRSSSDGVIAIR